MKSWSCSHLSDVVLLREFTALAWRERQFTAELVAHIAEVERRRLYAREGHPSMFRFCVDALHFSEHAAYRRIQVARTARRHPAILPALADGRLTLSAVLFLRPYLTRANAAGLLAAAFRRKKDALKDLIAEHFPRPDLPARVVPVASPAALAPPAALEMPAAAPVATAANVSERSGRIAPALVAPAQEAAIPLPASEMAPREAITPLSPGQYGIQFTLEREAYEQLRYALSLADHDVRPNDLAKLFTQALQAFVRERERRRFAACVRSPRVVRDKGKSSENPRYVPAHVRREVWRRDGGRCTFVAHDGRRCESCERLEFDHVTAVARGGESTAANLRLCCRAHNQLAAEQAFGAAVVAGHRERARRRVAEARLARARADERAFAPATPKRPQERPDPALARAAAAAVARAVEAAQAAERARKSCPDSARPAGSGIRTPTA